MLLALLAATSRSVCAAAPPSLEIYFIDVEGGQSTLVVTPDRHTLLIDAGWAGDGSGFRPGAPLEARDANRIVAAARAAGVSRIDYLLITHFHVDHDGGPDAADPATFAAFRPRVAIMNNGVSKGGALITYQALHQVPGLEGVWQLHLSAEAGDSNFAPPYVANLDESTAHWIELIARADGSFRILNQRTGEWKEYPPR